MRRALAAALLLAVLGTGPAAATEATIEQVRRLAEEAGDDPGALRQLRRVDSVDGEPVDLDRALEGATGEELERRLDTLAEGSAPGPATGPGTPRGDAREILGGGRYSESDLPRPFRAILDAIGRVLRAIGGWIADLASAISGGRPDLVLYALIAVVAVVTALLARRHIHRRRSRARSSGRDGVPEEAEPADLERLADKAEKSGDHERAIRLRFVAGLARLARARVVPARTSLTTSEVARLIRSRSFDAIASDFDEIVYGRRPARTEAVERSRSGWKDVLENAGER